MTLEQYVEYLRGKSVVFVGPAGYTKGQNRGAEFDAYDVVVRVNNGIGLACQFPHDLGTRTDVLYNTFLRLPKCRKGKYVKLGDIDHWKHHGLRLIIGPEVKEHGGYFHPKVIAQYDKLLGDIRRIDMPLATICGVRAFGGFTDKLRPSHGAVSIYHLVQQPLRHLAVFGITAYCSSYYQEYCPDKALRTYKNTWASTAGQRHESSAELHLFSLLAKDPRLAYDETLQALLEK